MLTTKGKKMSEDMIIKHCSPTLAGLKTGNMFLCKAEDEKELHSFTVRFNKSFHSKGLRLVILRCVNGNALIYVYRPSLLESEFKQPDVIRLLKENGYTPENPSKCIGSMIKKLRLEKEFPHEIGLFLGYPAEDVRGFIEKGSRNCKMTGCWKVYGNAEKAQKTFLKFKKCTNVYNRLYACGRSIEQLTVAV